MSVDLAQLEIAAEKACRWAFHERRKLKNAGVNWGDIGCYSAETYQDSRGDSGYRVNLEEASPDAWEFRAFIREYLWSHGFPDVEVRTEW